MRGITGIDSWKRFRGPPPSRGHFLTNFGAIFAKIWQKWHQNWFKNDPKVRVSLLKPPREGPLDGFNKLSN